MQITGHGIKLTVVSYGSEKLSWCKSPLKLGTIFAMLVIITLLCHYLLMVKQLSVAFHPPVGECERCYLR